MKDQRRARIPLLSLLLDSPEKAGGRQGELASVWDVLATDMAPVRGFLGLNNLLL